MSEPNERPRSSRKGKKNNLEKGKQPQRGLGVAQLEKIRLHSQMGSTHLPSIQNSYSSQEDISQQTAYSSSSFYGFPGQQNFTMGLSEIGRANIRFGDSDQPTNTTRWRYPTTKKGVAFLLDSEQPSTTRQYLFNLQSEDIIDKQRKESNSESKDSQELDLELRL